eukprot:g23662.t1
METLLSWKSRWQRRSQGRLSLPALEIVRVTEDFEAVALTAQHAVKACFEFMDGRHMKLKGNTEATMSHAAKGTVDMILAKVRQKAKPAKDELLARSLQAELESLLAIAEAEVSNVRTLQDADICQEAMEKAARQANVDKGDAADKALLSACTALEQPGQSALQATLRCTNLLDQNELKARSTKLASQARQLRNALDQLLEKAQLVKMAAIQRIEKEAKRVAAEKEAKRQEMNASVSVSFLRLSPKQEDIFDQYDQDQDGLLSSKEILAYVKGEHHFDLEEES